MFDDVMDLFEPDRRHRGRDDQDRGRDRGLRGLIGRLADGHDDRRYPTARGGDRRRSQHDDWDDDRDERRYRDHAGGRRAYVHDGD